MRKRQNASQTQTRSPKQSANWHPVNPAGSMCRKVRFTCGGPSIPASAKRSTFPMSRLARGNGAFTRYLREIEVEAARRARRRLCRKHFQPAPGAISSKTRIRRRAGMGARPAVPLQEVFKSRPWRRNSRFLQPRCASGAGCRDGSTFAAKCKPGGSAGAPSACDGARYPSVDAPRTVVRAIRPACPRGRHSTSD
jgi:hypothetical protein